MKRKLTKVFALVLGLITLNSCSTESTDVRVKDAELSPLVKLEIAELCYK